MRGERNELAPRRGARWAIATGRMAVFVPVLALVLAGCGSTNFLGSAGNIFSSQKSTDGAAGPRDSVADTTDVECPGVAVRTGAATLSIAGKSEGNESGALDLRYQGSIIRTARECHVIAGVMTMKVGIEGRIITGPAGGPGSLDVPLRIAVVHEGINPKAVASKFAKVPVTVVSAIDRVTFTHIESDLSYPMPVPLSDIDEYVVYVGFDPDGEPVKPKPAVRRKPAAKPRPANPKQS